MAEEWKRVLLWRKFFFFLAIWDCFALDSLFQERSILLYVYWILFVKEISKHFAFYIPENCSHNFTCCWNHLGLPRPFTRYHLLLGLLFYFLCVQMNALSIMMKRRKNSSYYRHKLTFKGVMYLVNCQQTRHLPSRKLLYMQIFMQYVRSKMITVIATCINFTRCSANMI